MSRMIFHFAGIREIEHGWNGCEWFVEYLEASYNGTSSFGTGLSCEATHLRKTDTAQSWGGLYEQLSLKALALQFLDVFTGQHAEFLFETLGEVLGSIESDVHWEFVDAEVRLSSHDSAGLFQSDAVDKSRYVLSGQGTESDVEPANMNAGWEISNSFPFKRQYW